MPRTKPIISPESRAKIIAGAKASALLRRKDYTGQRIGELTVIEFIGSAGRKNQSNYWKCLCSCGNFTEVPASKLSHECVEQTKMCKSCGQKSSKTHGLSRSPEYRNWDHVIQRCTNPNANHYDRYGGRGITVCEEWLKSFEKFLSYVGPRPTPKHTIGRIDNEGNYEPGNVKWETRKEQSTNRCNSVKLTADGVTLIRSDWARRLNVSARSLESWVSNHPEEPFQSYVDIKMGRSSNGKIKPSKPYVETPMEQLNLF